MGTSLDWIYLRIGIVMFAERLSALKTLNARLCRRRQRSIDSVMSILAEIEKETYLFTDSQGGWTASILPVSL
jgi:hypothetical protein